VSNGVGWDGESVKGGANHFNDLQQEVKTYVLRHRADRDGVPLHNGQILAADDLTEALVNQFGQQFALIDEFNALLAMAVGLGGDQIANADKFHENGEQTNTGRSDFTGGSKY
jgi:hypothetical protein